MAGSSYQVELLLKSLKRVQRIEQSGRGALPGETDERAEMPSPAGLWRLEEDAPAVQRQTVTDRSPLPEAVEVELERRAASFMKPPPEIAVPPIPKAKREPRPPKPPQRSLGEGD